MGELIRREVASAPLPFTGERLTSAVSGRQVEIEHYHRYLLARDFCRGQDVLDVASGEGYGTALLAQVARSAVGVEIDPSAVANSRREFNRSNLRYEQGDARALPIRDASIDVVVSFETLEHIFEHDVFIVEVRRVLRPGGLLVMSTPDRDIYSPAGTTANTYHVLELTKSQFKALLCRHFRRAVLAGQRAAMGSVIIGTERSTTQRFFERRGDRHIESDDRLPRATYLIALASDGDLPPFPASIYIHRSDLDAEIELSSHAEARVRVAETEKAAAQEAAVEANRRADAFREQAAAAEEAAAQEAAVEANRRADAFREQAAAAERSRAEAIRRGHEAEARATKTEAAIAATARTLAAIRLERDSAVAQSAIFERRTLAIENSTFWRATYPLRAMATWWPPGLRRTLRGGLKVVWWSMRFKLRSQLRERRRRLALDAAHAPVPPTLKKGGNLSDAAHAPVPATPNTNGNLVSSNVRLIYVSGEADTPGHIYRVLRPGAAAELLGYHFAWLRPDEIPARLDEIVSATILVIWRAMWSEVLDGAVSAARERGVRIVFDCDDLMFDPDLVMPEIIDGIRSQALPPEIVRNHFAHVRQTMIAADVCLATTEELAFHMRSAGKTTHVLPNSFDQATHNLSRQVRWDWLRSKSDDLIRLGYAGGSRTHQRDLSVAIDAIAKVLRENEKCCLVLFETSDGEKRLVDIEEFPSLVGLEDRIEWRRLQPLAELQREIMRFDVNLAPLEFGNPFCEAKSELKFFEAALVEVPTVASPTGPFRRALEHGRTGFLASTADEWYLYLKRLIENPELRRTTGRAAYHSVLAQFGPMETALKLGRIVAQLGGGVAGATAFALQAALAQQPRRLPRVFPSDVVFECNNGGAAPVTVIVPLYNYEQFITEALESVRRQTLRPLDLVVVDGCSTDNSLTVALAWAKKNATRFNRVVVLRNLANYGLAFCRNSGFDCADTPYVLPLDADNKLLPRCCEALLETILSKNMAYVYPSIQRFGASDMIINNVPYHAQRLVAGNFVDAMALVPKEAWARVGGYTHVRFGWEDYDFWCRLAESGLRGEWHPEVLAYYRVHPDSMCRSVTNAAENSRRLQADFARRHPWVSLVEQQLLRHPPKVDVRLNTTARWPRLKAILPILRCPMTKQKLTLDEAEEVLVSVDGLQKWPIINGRPVLSQHLSDPDVKPIDHISNTLPDIALDIIRQTDGLVLNLSAGGSATRYDNVVEVEYAIFRHTDIVADAHDLPFGDESFDAVISLNAFEHYSDPRAVAAELRRVLKPGGRLLVFTAFMQPLHEAPWHFYNATRYGVAEWFRGFDEELLHVSDNFHANHTLAWMASECEHAVRSGVSDTAADDFLASSIGEFVSMWREPARRDSPLWTEFTKLPQPQQEGIAAGFEFRGRKPPPLPKLELDDGGVA